MYLLGDAWYKFMPKPVETIALTIMKPSTKSSWRYISPGALATSGIYSQIDLEKLKDHIMFPAERPSLLNTVARSIMGRVSVLHGGSLSYLINETSIEKIAIYTWQRFWSKFLIFGNVSTGLLGIYLIVRVVKLLLDTLVHGYALHTVYGWSVYLLGAIWDSLSQLLLHLEKERPKTVNASASNSDTHESKRISLPESRIHAEPGHTYPTLPSNEDSTYTLELKG